MHSCMCVVCPLSQVNGGCHEGADQQEMEQVLGEALGRVRSVMDGVPATVPRGREVQSGEGVALALLEGVWRKGGEAGPERQRETEKDSEIMTSVQSQRQNTYSMLIGVLRRCVHARVCVCVCVCVCARHRARRCGKPSDNRMCFLLPE